jgi:hypothetical protein
MFHLSRLLVGISLFMGTYLVAQETGVPSTKPTEHLLGTISAVDPSAHTITVKDDKSSAETVVVVADTKTLLKVPPGAKDLKTAVRITSDQLQTGDRVDVRGFKASDDSSKIAASSVVLMSGRDLAAAHAVQAAEWQHSTPGIVSTVDSASGKISIRERTPEGPKELALVTSPQTEFLRYSPESPARPAPSTLNQIQPGDQVRVIADSAADGSTLSARKIYSGAFRTLNGTVISVSSDGKLLSVKDLATKKPVSIVLNQASSVHKLPPEMAAMLARRINRTASAGAAAPSAAATPPSADGAAERPAGSMRSGGGPGTGASRGNRNGDISQMIERLPKIDISDLKTGDAVVVSGAAVSGVNSQLIATQVIAGVEPILQSAPARQSGQALGGDWGLGEMQVPQ